ncbi:MULTISPECIES: PP2C family protein-serine/threonine phosphatase [Streptacidiphilus]|uniref:PP2C family protein-serine/threonine phosphatase n=2 Tax=Streptacidiphilus TaxID=228398 RepID=A0ABV6UMQ3_9ACTN|nr:PP2C family protein-serine/threonine phosphatase [Streptacidiphilus jeojiense]
MTERTGSVSNRASLLWTAGITVLVLGTGPLLSSAPELAGFLVFLPATIAAVGTVRQTVWVSAWIVLATAGALLQQPASHLAVDIALVVFSVAFGALAVYLCHWRISRTEQTTRLRSAATAMQRQLLRPLPQVTHEVLVAGVYDPLQEESLVGGDIYDVIETAYGTRVLLADVQGKGLPALGTAFAVIGAFREAAHREPTLTGVVEALEHAVVRQNHYAGEAGEPERFVTALVLGLDADPEAQVVNCGHPLPYILGPRGVSRLQLQGAHVPLGLGALVADVRTVDWFDLAADETLLLYTDGLIESRDREGSFFPLEERLQEIGEVTPSQLADLLRVQVRAFTGGRQQDDIAVLALRRASLAQRTA